MIQEILRLTQDIHSLAAYQKLCLDLARRPNAGVLVVMHYMTEGVKKHLLKKENGDFTEWLSENELVSVVTNSIYSSRETLLPDVTGNRVRENHLSSLCPPPVTTRRNKSVSFNEHIEMHFVPFEDRPSEWMQRAADPFRFERRIQMMEDMLSNVFLKKTFFFLHDYIEKI